MRFPNWNDRMLSRRWKRAAGLLFLGLLPLTASGADPGPVCWLRTMELVDRTTNPPEGGDNAFFTKVGGSPPLANLLILQTPFMLRLPGFDPTKVPSAERGCASSSFLNRQVWTQPSPTYAYKTNGNGLSDSTCANPIATVTQSGGHYDPSFIYPRIDDGCYINSQGNISQQGTQDTFDPSAFYTYLQWGDSGAGTGQTATNACNSLISGERSDCQKCLDGQNPYTTKGGYYISKSDPSKSVYSGNFLHFFGPTYLAALAASKNAVGYNAKIIWGIGNYDGNSLSASLTKKPNPSCNKFNTDFNPANRTGYINQLTNNSRPKFQTPTIFPAAQSLFAVGYFLTDIPFSNDSTYVRTGTGSGAWGNQQGGNQDSICANCQYTSTVMITDGVSGNDTTIHPDIKAMNIATPGDYENRGGSCTTDDDCGASTYCSLNTCVDRLNRVCTSSTANICGPNYTCKIIAAGVGTCVDEWYLDDVAAYFGGRDVRTGACYNNSTCDGIQKMTTYVINVGRPNNPALKNVAKKGNDGLYFEGTSPGELRDAFDKIINDILKRSTSYSVASVTSVQTRTTTAVFIPRFKPSVLTFWEGHLYRYKLFNENAAGCTSADTSPTPPATKLSADQLSRNPNGNSSCGDVYTVDANGQFVGENSDGDFMVLNSSFQPTTTPATPIWDAAERLKVMGPANRTIHTYVDSDADGVVDEGEQLAFTTANVSALLPALNLGGVTGDFCQTLAADLGMSFATESDCASVLIRYVRGEDVFDENANGLTTDARPIMLGDIFHSSPVLVVPPLNRSQTASGFNKQQSSPSLFGTPTVITNSSGANQYDKYVTDNATRTRFVMVGTNGGMLHAFHAGAYRTGDDPETAYTEPSDNIYYDQGTGDELWAFIPPEMLPKLKLLLMGVAHQEYVDGNPMVRDIWVDLNKDGKKTSDEFRTVAVTGMRRGGRTFFALDVTSPESPKYLWTAPKLGTTDYLMAGQSWSDFAPKPPPIVPMAVKNTSGYTAAFQRNNEDAREQWVVWTGGGWDPAGLRGRSINAYDVWSGSLVYRYAGWQASSSSDRRASMGPVVAPVALVNWGDPTNDGSNVGTSAFFDVANVGDVVGNLWTVRMHANGADTDSDGLYDNWYTGRAFETNTGGKLSQKLPFFQMAQHVIFPTEKVLRVYMGTGDRANMRDLQGGVCSLNNIPACLRKGCTVDAQMTKQNVGTTWTSSGRWNANGTSTSATNNTISASGSAAPVCDAAVDVAYSVRLDCSSATVTSGGQSPPAAQTFTYGLTCANGIEPCATRTTRPSLSFSNFAFDGATLNNRFYSVPVFGAVTGRTDLKDASAATTYDGARLTDTSSVMASPGNASTGGTFAALSGTYQGWYLNLGSAVTANPQDERSSDVADVPDGQPYVYWQTFTPGAITSSSDICSRQAFDTGALYHADLVTGGTAADTGTNVSKSGTLISRRDTQSVITPPKTLIEQKVVTPSGQVISTLLSIEPGQTSPKSIETARTDLYTPIQVLEIDRKTHQCRHVANEKCD
jgi:type IV pilus assembly protein PilY1